MRTALAISLALVMIVPAVRPARAADVPSVQDLRYFAGVNLPWVNWGCDFGCPNRGVTSAGTQDLLATSFGQLQTAGIHTVRWFTFEGSAHQIIRDNSGAPSTLNSAVYADFDAALALAPTTRRRTGAALRALQGQSTHPGLGHHGPAGVWTSTRARFRSRRLKPRSSSWLAPFTRIHLTRSRLDQPGSTAYRHGAGWASTSTHRTQKLGFSLTLTRVQHAGQMPSCCGTGTAHRKCQS
jgi:hypothetical protein